MLALMALGGCWPYVPADWRDRVPPDPFEPFSHEVAGYARWAVFQGEYWEDATPVGEFGWGLLDEPSLAYDPWTLRAGPAVGTCEEFRDPWAPVQDAGIRLPQLDTSILEGPSGPVALSGSSEVLMLSGVLLPEDLSEDFAYSWPESRVEDDSYGSSALFRFPGSVPIIGPELAAVVPTTVPDSELVWSWGPSDDEGVVGIILALTTASGSVLENRFCVAALSDGRFDLRDEDWGNNGVQWLVTTYSYSVTQAFLGDGRLGSFLIVHETNGILTRER